MEGSRAHPVSPWLVERGCTASPGCKYGKGGVQSLLPREISCCLSTSPSPGQGANATVGLKRKEELPPDFPGLLQPHQPRKAGLPEECSVTRTCPVHRE